MASASLVIPVLNHEPRLEEVLADIKTNLQDLHPEVIVVYDVTGDELLAGVEAEQADLQARFGIKPLTRVKQRGFGSALKAAATAAHGDVVIPIMADCCDDLTAIPRMLAKIDAGADVVVGSRYMAGGQIVGDTAKQRISRYYSWMLRRITGISCHDVSNSFKAYRREIWTTTSIQAQSFDVSVELTVKAMVRGYRLDEVPSIWTNRRAGQSQFRMARELSNYGRWLIYAAEYAPRRNYLARGISLLARLSGTGKSGGSPDTDPKSTATEGTDGT